MRSRFKILTAATAAFVALALGGAAISSATQSANRKHAAPAAAERTGGVDNDAVQSGDQTTPDTSAADSADASSESSSESGAANDGPGGHEDPAGNVDNQEEGTE